MTSWPFIRSSCAIRNSFTSTSLMHTRSSMPGPGSRPIAIVFGLIGIYLYVEKNFTGRQVQRAHMRLARHRRTWMAPAIPPDQRANIGVADVLAAPPGPLRHGMIRRWCESVWQDWRESRSQITALAQTELGIDP